MRLLLILPVLPVIAACQPAPEPVPFSPVGYRHLDHDPPEEALDILRIEDEEIPSSALRVKDGCYAVFVDGTLRPVARGGRQFCTA